MPARNPLTSLVRRILRLDSPLGYSGGEFHPLFDQFELIPTLTQTAASSNQNFDFVSSVAAGTAHASAQSCTQATRGGITLNAGHSTPASGAAGDRAHLVVLAASGWGTSIGFISGRQTVFEAVVRMPSALTTMGFFVGLKSSGTNLSTTDASSNSIYTAAADQIGVMFDTAAQTLSPTSANVAALSTTAPCWVGISSNNGTDETLLTSSHVRTDGEYLIRIVIGTDLKARVYIAQTSGTTSATASTGDPVTTSTSGTNDPQLVYTSQTLRASGSATFTPEIFVISRVATENRTVTVRYLKLLKQIP